MFGHESVPCPFLAGSVLVAKDQSAVIGAIRSDVRRSLLLRPVRAAADDSGIEAQLGRGWLLLWFLGFLGLALLPFSHDWSPCSDYIPVSSGIIPDKHFYMPPV